MVPSIPRLATLQFLGYFLASSRIKILKIAGDSGNFAAGPSLAYALGTRSPLPSPSNGLSHFSRDTGSLAWTQTLTELDVSGNHGGDTVAKALALAIRHNRSLKVLEWDRNDITYVGVKAFQKSLKLNRKLYGVNLPKSDMEKQMAGLAEQLRMAQEAENRGRATIKQACRWCVLWLVLVGRGSCSSLRSHATSIEPHTSIEPPHLH